MTNENLDRPEGEYPLSSLINPITAERLDGKPLSEHSVEEIYDFFQYCDAITYVFLAWGEGDLNEIGPNVLSALELGVTGRPRAVTPYFPVIYGFLACRMASTTGIHSTGRSMVIHVGE